MLTILSICGRRISSSLSILCPLVIVACTTSAPIKDNIVYPCQSGSPEWAEPLLGEWNVNWKYRSAPGEYQLADAKAEISTAVKGCVITEQFSAMKGDDPFYAEWSIAIKNGIFSEATWIDTGHGGYLKFQKAESSPDWPVSLIWHHQNGRMKVRYRRSEINNDQFTSQRHLSTDGGTQWALTSDATYTKR